MQSANVDVNTPIRDIHNESGSLVKSIDIVLLMINADMHNDSCRPH